MKIALVTAFSAGLGAVIARAFIPEMRVVIYYHSSPERANTVLKELSNLVQSTDGGPNILKRRFTAILAGLSQRSEILRLILETVTKVSRLDVAVSNAGWTRLTNFRDLDDNVKEDDWDCCFNLNVKSHLLLLLAAREHLESNEGSFITTASAAGVKPMESSLVRILSPCLSSRRATLTRDSHMPLLRPRKYTWSNAWRRSCVRE